MLLGYFSSMNSFPFHKSCMVGEISVFLKKYGLLCGTNGPR